ncbi:NAD-dependent epimerase/dehydratase family protein [Helicobacter saguini]|uniref:NAD-dependent epimerase/dehydratase family protein n=1 Tax=Helicobacter saguini TaxID=1548018 RepID=UPI001926BE7F|nr:NAD-dependent epimerase/dehydratase family protein [Helicobacter saguini]
MIESKKIKLLITGASGFIGSNFIKTMHEKYDITALVRESSNVDSIKNYAKIYIYNRNIESLSKFLKKENFSGILHLATLYIKNHKSSDIANLIDSNITFGSEILESLSQINFKGFFINICTFWQFYKNVKKPLNLYAATKDAFLDIVNFYADSTEIKFSNVYLNDTYGSGDTRPKIFNLWSKIALSGESVDMSGGEQIIDMLHISDVVNALNILIDILESNMATLAVNRHFVLHSNEQKSLKEIAKIYENALNVKLNINWGALPYATRENFIPYEFGDTLPTWQAQMPLEQGFRLSFGDDIESVKHKWGGGVTHLNSSHFNQIIESRFYKTSKFHNFKISKVQIHFTLSKRRNYA